MGDSQRLSWSAAAGLVPDAVTRPERAHLVDSWLVDGGKVRGMELHEGRFRRSCAAMPDLAAVEVAQFLLAVRATLPATGRWFPRVEAHRDNAAQLVLWLRPAPVSQKSIALWISEDPDTRIDPRHKGPDLGHLAKLRDRARISGADDAVLCSANGVILETAHSALVWWDGDTLCMPDPELPLLPSITANLLTTLAHERGVEVRHRRCVPEDLWRSEVWAVNALHGIRPVTRWTYRGAVLRAVPRLPQRLADWRAALDATARAIDGSAA